MATISFSFIEIPVLDMDRAVKFYEYIMDIRLQAMEYAGALMAFFPRKSGTPGCSLIKDDSYVPTTNGVLVYLDAWDDMDRILERIETSGGQIALEKTMISENHYYAKFIDSEGNQLAIFSTK